jgi:predicted NAD-dependent protein-ADP-ribosyltransferase YbiA (DUF1768 family)
MGYARKIINAETPKKAKSLGRGNSTKLKMTGLKIGLILCMKA